MRRESGILNREVLRAFPAEASALREVREHVRVLAEEDAVPEQDLSDLLIAVSEACTNVVRHAGASEMKLRWRVEGDRLEVEVQDSGVFLDRPRDPARAGGFGIPLMRSLMDEVVVLRGDRGHPGTRVLLVKRLPARAGVVPASRTRGLRTRHLHPGSPVRAERKGRRLPTPNLLGLGVAATVVALLAVFGTLVIRHNSHPPTALTSGRSPGASQPVTHRSPGAHHTKHATHHGHGQSAHHPRSTKNPVPPSPGQGPTAPAGVTLPQIPCPGTALLGVYLPVRFDVLDTCRWVQGRVDSVRLQHDGNQRVTLIGASGHRIVVQIILGQHLPVPRVGERIAAFGTLVRNRTGGWTGLEPTWAIDYPDRREVRRSLPPATPLFPGGNVVCVPGSPPVCTAVPTPTVSVSVPVSVPSIP